MLKLARRFDINPILSPQTVKPSRPDWTVECVLNPGAFRYQGRTGLLLRVAERPPQEANWVSTPVFDSSVDGGIRIIRVRKDDPKLEYCDPRILRYDNVTYLTTLSHLRLAWSDDGVQFKAEDKPALIGANSYETYGIEDCRVNHVGNEYLLTYTAVSERGVAVGMARTCDWKHYLPMGVVLPPHNKDVAIFDRLIGGKHYMLHRPSGSGIGGNYIWMASSPDLTHWGNHHCIAMTRPGNWDCERVGAGAAPIRTDKGWLEIYHGADNKSTYHLGLLLLDLNDPTKVLARSKDPIMSPETDYEKKGFFGGVVFTNGHVLDGDKLTLYYGAADTVSCGATFSLSELLATLE